MSLKITAFRDRVRLIRIGVVLSLSLALLPFAACTSSSTAAKTEDVAKPEEEAEKLEYWETMTEEELKVELVKSYSFGDSYYRQGDFKKGLAYLHTAGKIDKKLNGENLQFPGIYQKIGRSFHELSIPDSALIVFEEGLKYNQDDLYMNSMIVYYYKAYNRIDQYIPAAEKVIGMLENPEEKKEYMLQLKDVRVQRNEYDKAIEIYDALIAMEPENKDFIDARLSLLRLSGGDTALRTEFEEKHKQFPDDKNYILELITIYEKDMDNELLIGLVDELLALEPNDVESREVKVKALIDLERERDAINVLLELNKLVPDEPRYLTEIAEIYNDLQNYIQAVNYANRALAIRSGFGEAYFWIGTAFMNCANDVKNKRNKQDYEDKLVYQMAYDEFKLAARDVNKRSEAQRWISYLENLIPTNEDKFMHKDIRQPNSDEYKWLLKYFKSQ